MKDKAERSERSERSEGSEQSWAPEVAEFMGGIINGSLMRYEVLRFFHQNPYAILTVSDLSTWMSREEKPLAEALQRLSQLGYLVQSYASAAYVLTSDREKRHHLDRFFD